MIVKANLNNLRISARKVRLVADMIRGKSTDKAAAILSFTTKKASKPILKLLNSALANAKNNLKLDPTNLFVEKIEVNDGPKYKRMRPRARGQGFEIQKKTAHIIMVLNDKKHES
ncbi:MAG: 50S ribosomal protein L22 [Candidatus Nealsonbacteria bacterium RIFCSPHIGHO2_01_FULL_43_31]|uniref:Large ribosomal subunit protein uL22 n=2 Tax=Candidatus Nealsoniibacteriota TaxID=1817911 RepID=A0A1G2E7P4_9BACT|nr:MAG: 50S ribosomal protein L22 [Candidatus Nealsonbacteria bacterium RIFCSPHIGHO2_01_FULL_43_31]OGZ21281.1 MAG: 50S ribosomal protein L22 [Candidatus Nealsonbacteria bacterium RIFCSPHIGHO2_02_FULL_43_13]OGZ24551.1 MAG: 50S ribosomal protein L22 [Candidatus Nealsonbacteria bacterium RIFCSPLOWO2_01_FULL_43_36]